MIPEKGKRYLLAYHFDDYYTDIGTYTGETWREEDRLEYRFKVDGGTLLATEEDIKKCIDNPHDGSTLDNFLLLEEYNKLKAITDRILREFPVGNIAEHTIESIPDRISYYLKELVEYTQKAEDWEDCADRLFIYAKEIQCTVVNRALYEAVREDIETYKRLKNG